MDTVIAYVPFTDAEVRPVYEQPDQRQYVIDPDGVRIFGVWFIPRDVADAPIVIDH